MLQVDSEQNRLTAVIAEQSVERKGKENNRNNICLRLAPVSPQSGY
jgi:hypothetical protein